MRKKTDEQKDMERWNVDMSGEFSAVPMQYAERKKLEHEESQIEEARKLTKDYSDEELRKMKPKQLYSVIMRQCYAYKQVKRGWFDIYLERLDAPEQILEAEILIKKFQTNGWFGDHCLRLPEQVVDAAIRIKRPDWALDFLRDNMTFRFFPRAETFQKLMNHYSSLGDFPGVLTVWQLQKDRGYHATKSTVHCLLKAYVENNEIPSAAWVVSRAFKKKDLFDDSNLELALSVLINHSEVASSQGVSLNNFVDYLKDHESLVLSENTNGLLSLAHLQSGKIDSVVALASKSKDLESFFQSYSANSSLFSSPSSKEQLSQLLNSLSSQNVQFPDSLKKLTETPQPEPEAPVETTETPSTESAEQTTETTETKEN